MLIMRPSCERCDVDLPAQTSGALICSFECTFCSECGVHFNHICPNCGGGLVARPTRAVPLHEQFPPSTERVRKHHD